MRALLVQVHIELRRSYDTHVPVLSTVKPLWQLKPRRQADVQVLLEAEELQTVPVQTCQLKLVNASPI